MFPEHSARDGGEAEGIEGGGNNWSGDGEKNEGVEIGCEERKRKSKRDGGYL